MKPLALLATLFTAVRGLLPVLVVLALLLSACVAKLYEGPERPNSEIAAIDRWHSHDWVVLMMGILPIPVSARHETNVFNIDGKRPCCYRFHVLPGQHIADVRYVRKPYVALCSLSDCLGGYAATLSISFTAEAGHEYRIPAERSDERNWIWVEDITTGKVVAGEKPPDDNGEGKPPETSSERP